MNRWYYGLLFFLFLPLSGNAQAIYSLYFAADAHPETTKLIGFDSKYYANYELVGEGELDLRVVAGNELVVDETGVYIQKNKVLSISREEVRENSKYLVRGGYLHGVVENDSVMVALSDEKYFFLMLTKSYLFETGAATNQLFKGTNQDQFFLLNTEDNGYQSIISIRFSGNQVILLDLDYEQTSFDFRAVTGKKMVTNDGIPTYILSPSKEEWQTLMKHFIAYDTYQRKTS